MKLGFQLPHMMNLKAVTQPWELDVTGQDQTALLKWAETLGYEMVSVPEHHLIPEDHIELSGGFYFHALAAMSYFAGATEKMRVNSCIHLLPLQNPIVTAKALSTMDWLSGGRVTINFGVGWLKEEFDMLGVPFNKRGALADEYLAIMVELWTKERPEYEGQFYSFKDVAFEPKPVQKGGIPMWFGGDADAAIKRAGRYGSGWQPFLTPANKIAERLDFIRSQPDYAGKMVDVSYAMSTASIGEGHVVIEDEMAKGGKSKQEIMDTLGFLAEQGVTWSGVPTPPIDSVEEWRDHIQWVAEEIIPAAAPL